MFTITPLNASKIGVYTDDQGEKDHLYEFLRFEDPSFKPNRYSKSTWDGVVRLFDKRVNQCSYGLLSTILVFCKANNYEVKLSPDFNKDILDVSLEDMQEWCDGQDFRDEGIKIEPYDYQVTGLHLAIRYSRMTLLAATAAGKSLLQYMIIRFFEEMKGSDCKILLVVPSINLVSQMKNDFTNYSSANGWNADNKCNLVSEGSNPHSNKMVTIATWQSLKNLDPDYFKKFDLLLIDECHLSSGKSLSTIADNCSNAYNRIGLTGTLKNNTMHPLQVQQHFGPIRRIVSTKQLQDAGRAAKTQVTMIQIEHTTADRQMLTGEYTNEIDFLLGNKFRNGVIKKLAKTLKGNTLMLFDRIDAHLEIIADQLREEMPDRIIKVINGKVKNVDRDVIKMEMGEGDDILLLGSFGCVGTGLSIKKLHNLVLCHPSKSIVRILQAIGRMLRLHKTKDIANIYDLVDIANYLGLQNHAMRHAKDRLGFYVAEGHPVKVIKMVAK